MPAIPRHPGIFILAALVLGLTVPAVPPAGTAPAAYGPKPDHGLELTWDAPLLPAAGRTVELTLTLHARFAVPAVRVEVIAPPDLELLGSLPAYDGPLQAGETRRFPVTARVPARPTAPLRARAEVHAAAVPYRVGAQVDLTPLTLRAPAVRPVPVTGPEGGGLLQFTAARLPAAAPAPPAGAAPAAPGAVTLEGHFYYRDRLLDPQGFTYAVDFDNPVLPIRHADADLYQVDGNTDIYVASAVTDEEGAFRFTVNPVGGETYRVRVKTSTGTWGGSGGTDVRVKVSPSQPDLYAVASTPVPNVPGSTSLGDWIAEPDAGGEAFNVMDACLAGAELVRSWTGSLPPFPLSVYWRPAETVDGTYYSFSSIHLLGEEGFDDPVIIHEYGHFVAAQYSRDQSPGGIHYVDDQNQRVTLSWSEGWASYFQAAARRLRGDAYPSWYIDTSGEPGAGNLLFSYECEGPSYAVRGAGSEVAVQSALWDVEDDAATPDEWPGVDDDPLALPRADIWQVVSGPMKTANTVSIEDFWDGWFGPGGPAVEPAGMAATFGALGMEFTPDAFEPDDEYAQASPLATDGTPAHHSFYPAGDQDRHRLTLAAGQEMTVESLNLIGGADTYLQVLGPDQAVLAQNDNRSLNDPSSLVTFTAPADGDYEVRVSRPASTSLPTQYAQYGSYDVRAVAGIPGTVGLVSKAGSGLNDGGFGVGAAFADYDGDGDADLYVVNNAGGGTTGSRDALYRNLGAGTFQNATLAAGLGNPEGGFAAAWGDYDNDGDPDLFVTDHGLFRNNGNGTFTDVTGISGVSDRGREADAAWADVDRDGYLDLFVACRDTSSVLWRNQGDGTFSDATASFGLSFPTDGGEAYGCAFADYDRNRYPDLFVASDRASGRGLYRNVDGTRFEEVTGAAGLASSDAARGAVWADVDGDGLMDLFVTSSGPNALFINNGNGTFTDRASSWGVDDTGASTGAALADYDLDGDLDLYVVNLTGPNALYQNLGGAMVRVDAAADPNPGYGCAWGDVDGDGDPDLYVVRPCLGSGCLSNLLYTSAAAGTGGRSWLKVKLTGVATNTDGIGARIEVYAGGKVQVREVGTGVGWASKTRLPELFGVPAGAPVDSVYVFWPSSAYNVIRDVAPGATLTVEEDTSTPVLPPPAPPVFSLRLLPPAPNPFRGAISVAFDLGAEAPVRAEVFDLTGRRVRTLVDRTLAAGHHLAGWDGTDDGGRTLPQGIYFYRLRAGGKTEVRKLVRLGS